MCLYPVCSFYCWHCLRQNCSQWHTVHIAWRSCPGWMYVSMRINPDHPRRCFDKCHLNPGNGSGGSTVVTGEYNRKFIRLQWVFYSVGCSFKNREQTFILFAYGLPGDSNKLVFSVWTSTESIFFEEVTTVVKAAILIASGPMLAPRVPAPTSDFASTNLIFFIGYLCFTLFKNLFPTYVINVSYLLLVEIWQSGFTYI